LPVWRSKVNNISSKFLIFTNFPYFQYRKRWLDAGAEFFFYKAAEFEKLIKVLKQLIPYYRKTEKSQ